MSEPARRARDVQINFRVSAEEEAAFRAAAGAAGLALSQWMRLALRDAAGVHCTPTNQRAGSTGKPARKGSGSRGS